MAAGRTGEEVEVDLEGKRKVQTVLLVNDYLTSLESLPMTRCSHSLRLPE